MYYLSVFVLLMISQVCAKDYSSSKVKELAYKIKDLSKKEDLESAKKVIQSFHAIKSSDKEVTPDDIVGFLSIVSRTFNTLSADLDKQIIEYFNETQNCRGQSIYYQFKANNEIEIGNLPAAKQHIYKALSCDSICKDTLLQVVNIGLLSNILYYEGNYNDALTLMDRNYLTLLQLNDSINLISNLITRGATHKVLGHSYTAAELFKTALHYANHNPNIDEINQGLIKNNLGVIFMEQMHYTLAEKMYNENISFYHEKKMSEIPSWLPIAHINIAGISIAKENRSRFMKHIAIADSLMHKFPVYLRTYLPIRFRGKVKFMSKKEATDDIQRLDSIIIAENNNVDNEYLDVHAHYYRNYNQFIMPESIWPVLDSLALQDQDLLIKLDAVLCQLFRYKSQGNNEKVSEWAIKYANLIPRVDSLHAMALIADMAAQYQLKELTEQIEVNAAERLLEAKKTRQYQYFLIGLSVLLIILALNLYFILKNYKRSKNLLLEKDQVNLSRTRLLQNENLLLVQKNKHAQVENEFERNKIVYASKLLNQLNTMIGEVETMINGSDNEVSTKLRSFKHQLITLRETNSQNEEVLIQNKDLNSDTESYLRKKLGDVLNDMSPAELQILVLSKVGFLIKDIASHTGYSVSYVENIRSGLRKKLNVPTEIKLQDYLMSL